ncbi:hypothetical protein DYBT9275_03901 [Dyadobacter sp. CECT 9275]|uniref:Uncharacterized protein n=1 Tax=Dyadobacter helix TaxID=2822344 RepID=A0A916JFR0_9BACT|nr:hypothetical protein [Dyadobacter sp. CECT 9275]CAG5006809.1 hypothetical protein DYBT9275_03901 [Dyadobacter sp. CECT 9275]
MTSMSTTACGGRAANPVMTTQYGDQKKSCRALESEMIGVQQEISHLVPKTDKTGKNVALGVAGAFVLFPWFFMDFSHAEEEEVNAYRQRYNNLASLAADKGCDIDTRPIPVIKSHASKRFKEDSKLN